MKLSGKIWTILIIGCIFALAICAISFNLVMEKTSTNTSCMSCHVHPEADESWTKSVHHNGETGTVTNCVACHLPPEGNLNHITSKMKIGSSHLLSYIFKKKDNIDWDKMKELEHAKKTVFNVSCESCHQNLYPEGIDDDGIVAHLHYDENKGSADLHCISCHLDAGHYDPNYKHKKMVGKANFLTDTTTKYEVPATITEFKNFVETVPGTGAAISMIAIPGGSFQMGSPEKEAFHQKDESPVHTVNISPFFMAEVEITWDQYWSFYNETMSEGRTPPAVVYANNSREDIDAVTGPTPPFGNPDHGWGMGDRPAITMTHYAAETFCQWLSLKTGKKYRLPTEAEWEYAARGGTTTPYFFECNPSRLDDKGLINKIFGTQTDSISRYVIYAYNSNGRTQEPSAVSANRFGLKNMLGNVMEYCSDYYAEDAYSSISDGTQDPKGPASGTEYVVRGGSYSDPASQTRCAARNHTEHDKWLVTDPQNPKSIWWYSDVIGIGFRVVCEVPENIATN